MQNHRELFQVEPLRPKTPSCQATRKNRYANDKPGPLPMCDRQSRYVVDGKYYCKAHAGDAALSFMIGKESSDAE